MNYLRGVFKAAPSLYAMIWSVTTMMIFFFFSLS
jgi:hypothetical protein